MATPIFSASTTALCLPSWRLHRPVVLRAMLWHCCLRAFCAVHSVRWCWSHQRPSTGLDSPLGWSGVPGVVALRRNWRANAAMARAAWSMTWTAGLALAWPHCSIRTSVCCRRVAARRCRHTASTYAWRLLGSRRSRVPAAITWATVSTQMARRSAARPGGGSSGLATAAPDPGPGGVHALHRGARLHPDVVVGPRRLLDEAPRQAGARGGGQGAAGGALPWAGVAVAGVQHGGDAVRGGATHGPTRCRPAGGSRGLGSGRGSTG